MFFWKKLLLVALVAFVIADDTQDDINVHAPDDRIFIEVYSETLCPYCHKFIDGPLRKALETPDIWNIARFRIIPYGNAQMTNVDGEYTFDCQHGQAECQGNIIESCAWELYDQQTKAWPFILCLEQTDKDWNTDGKTCADQFGMDWQAIRQCTNSPLGVEKQFYAGLETKYVGIRSVPTVRVNGDTDDSGLLRRDPLAYICTNYPGQYTIKACQQYF